MRYKMNDYDQQQMKGKAKIEQKKLKKIVLPGTKLPAPLETLQRAFKMLKRN